GQGAHPQVDVVHAAVQVLQLLLDGLVGSDLAEARHPGQAVGGTDGVVVGQAVVPAALDVERGQVEAALPRLAEQEDLQLGDNLVVDLLGVVGRQVLQDRVHAALVDQGRVEEGIGEADFVELGGGVGVEELDVRGQQAVAQAEPGGRELGGDARVDVGVVAPVRRDDVVAQKRGQELVEGDRLNLADDDGTGGGVDRLVSDRRVSDRGEQGRDQDGEAVVLTHEERVQGGQ